MSSIGDIVLTFPLLAVLKQQFPGVQLDFVVRQEYAELLQAAPSLNTVFVYNRREGLPGLWQLRKRIRPREYDLILDLHANLRSVLLSTGVIGTPVYRVHKMVWRRWLLVHLKWNLYPRPISVAEKYLQTAKPLGIPATIPREYFFIPHDVTERMAATTRELLLQNYRVVMAPGARHATKQWPVAYYQQLTHRIATTYGWKCVLLGSREERAILETIAAPNPDFTKVFAGDFSLLESAEVIRQLPYFISNDSGLMHIAAALHKPQIAIFGPTVREFGFFPLNENAIIIEQSNLACRPCSHLGGEQCPKGHFRCMRDSTPEMVFAAFQQLVQQKGEPNN